MGNERCLEAVLAGQIDVQPGYRSIKMNDSSCARMKGHWVFRGV